MDKNEDVTKRKKELHCCFILVFLGLLFLGGCVHYVSLAGCTGGIDGHVHHLSQEQKDECIRQFPNYDFRYKK